MRVGERDSKLSGPVHFRAVTLLVGCLALSLTGCNRRFSNANLEVVNHEFEQADKLAVAGARDAGVSPKEVESIMGPPTHAETTRLPLETQKKEVDVVRYFYEQDGQTVAFHFFDNKLIAKVPLLNDAGKPAPNEANAAPGAGEAAPEVPKP